MACTALLLHLGCYSAETVTTVVDVAEVREVSYAEEKRLLIAQMELRMNEMMRRYEGDLDAIRDELQSGLRELQPPARLISEDRSFRGYGAPEMERFEAEIDHLVEDAVSRTETLVGRERSLTQEKLVGQVETEAFAIAREVGGDAQGAGYGFESGVQEVDERARVTIELLKGSADVSSLRKYGTLRRGEVLDMNTLFQHDLTEEELVQAAPGCAEAILPAKQGMLDRIGRLTLFRSDVLDGFRMKGQDTTGVSIVFQNDRLPVDRPLHMIQGRRTRVVRGGMVVQDFPWILDPGTPHRDGRLAMRANLVEPRVLASEPILPAVNMDHDQFDRLRDFTIVYDYKTGLMDGASGELLGALSWQMQWIVSAVGNVRALPSTPPSFDPTGEVITRLLAQGPTAYQGEGGKQSNPSDLFQTRHPATTSPFEVRQRQLVGGGVGTLVELTGTDLVRVKPEGRRYLAAHRLRTLSDGARFFSYLDGQRDRYVLSLTWLDEDSVLRDLGFRAGDALLGINGTEIKTFPDLWAFFSDHGRESRYEFHIERLGAQRQLTYEVAGVPPENQQEEEFNEDLSDEMVNRLTRLFNGSGM